MDKVKSGDNVKVHYIGRLKDGTEFDNSRTRNEGKGLDFKLGDGRLLKGFNDAVVGLEIGETTKITLNEEQAYGKYIPEARMDVKKTDFPPDMKFELNALVSGQGPDGQPMQAKIIKIEEESVNLDMNHPLAGEELSFEIELVEVLVSPPIMPDGMKVEVK